MCTCIVQNEVFDDPTFKTYIRSCNTDLCNSGKLRAPAHSTAAMPHIANSARSERRAA